MESGDIYKAGSSFRLSSPSMWRDATMEIFSKSSREDDDEEALKWAALQKLPTYNRLTKGLLTTPQGETSEIDVHHLGLKERRSLVERVGIAIPTIEVHFEHLNVEAEAHVGSRALPTFLNFSVNIMEGFLNYLHILPSRKKHLSILQDVSGVIKPSRMTLLLGPPSSGKTTLLLALAGELDPDLKFSGKVTYNGHEMHEFVPQRTAAYVSQHDVHIGEMTVRETLAFSARCQGVGSRYEMLAELARREKAANIKPDPDVDIYMKALATEGQEVNVVTDYILKVLGLEVCADTLVGNQMLRGISGGQRKRVTTGEMLVGPSKVLFMDEISTGLDSSTTFQIVNSIKQYVHIFNGTAVISLLQPAPETYNLFDDIILISDSQIAYQGPREQVLEFFESMGFKCPERKGVADFLQEVTSRKDQEQYWAQKDEPYNFVTVKEFAEAFQSFHVGQKLGDELATQFDKAKSHPAALTTRKYGVKKAELLKACLSREFLLMNRNSFVYIFKFIQLTIMAMIVMTTFLRTEMHRNSVTDGGIYSGALFYSVVVIMFNGTAEISMTVAKLPVFFKQRKLLFYPSWAYSLPAWIIKIPITFVEVAVWVFITYYVIGFDPSAGRFFRQYLLLLLLNQMASALFRFTGAIGRGDLILANTFGSFALVMLFALGGFVLSRENIKKWWIWGYWMSPMMYAQNAIVVNEFLGKSWRHVLPNSMEPLGVEVLKSRGFFTHAYWYWIGVGALIGFILLFNAAFTLALTYLNPLGKPQSVKSEEPESNGQDYRSRESNSSHKTSIENGYEMKRGSNTSSLSSISTDTSVEINQNRNRGMTLPFDQHTITFDEIKYSVTSRKDQEQYWAQKDEPYNFVTVKEFAEAFQSFHVGQKLGDELATQFDKAKSHPAALTTRKYGVKKAELLKACLSREFLLMNRNSFVYIFKFIQLTIMAMIVMTTFLRTEMHRNSVTDGGIYCGALFYSVVVIMFNGTAEISMTVAKLPVFFKQRKLLFYPSWAYSLPAWIIKIPITYI
ncbi:pleiotropic drug resistance protein 1 [Quercus suber]|uniref:Pleiotropic drug resistance protein 1 n=1 Tax=Quercus suber TaxID=58331 RepID=A0AAW0JYF9_QUESU